MINKIINKIKLKYIKIILDQLLKNKIHFNFKIIYQIHLLVY